MSEAQSQAMVVHEAEFEPIEPPRRMGLGAEPNVFLGRLGTIMNPDGSLQGFTVPETALIATGTLAIGVIVGCRFSSFFKRYAR